MKKLTILLLMFSTGFLFSQTKIATTEDGKRVILNADKTWQYIDSSNAKPDDGLCNLGDDFKEMKRNKNVKRLIKQVAVENDCKYEDVVLINFSEGQGSGMYSLCVKGTKMKYRMIGSAFLKADASPYSH